MTLMWFLLIAGLILIVAELYLPGMVVGTIGVICLIASVVLCFRDYGGKLGAVYLAGVVVMCVAVVAFGLKYFPNTPFGRKMVLDTQSGNADKSESLAALKGKRGTAHTQLRPAGTALIDGKRVDVVTEGMIVSKGSEVEVVAVDGYRVIVRKV